LRQARRELYELRFKHAVGQLENSSQISKVRHDIARIMTVLGERELGIVTHVPAHETAAVAVAEKDEGFEPEEEEEEKLASPPRAEVDALAPSGEQDTKVVEASEMPKSKPGRKAKGGAS
jgi:ribosomal protein L29